MLETCEPDLLTFRVCLLRSSPSSASCSESCFCPDSAALVKEKQQHLSCYQCCPKKAQVFTLCVPVFPCPRVSISGDFSSRLCSPEGSCGHQPRVSSELGAVSLHLPVTFDPSDQLFFLLRQHETVAPLEDPTVTEVTSTLQEWALLWKQLYVVRSNLSMTSDPSARTKQTACVVSVCVCVCVCVWAKHVCCVV